MQENEEGEKMAKVKKELMELRSENRRLRREIEDEKRLSVLLKTIENIEKEEGACRMERRALLHAEYSAIRYHTLKNGWKIEPMCRALGISRSGYYRWLKSVPGKRSIENKLIAQWVLEYAERFGNSLGYRRMRSYINRMHGTNYSKHRIYRIMKVLGLSARGGKGKKAKTLSSGRERTGGKKKPYSEMPNLLRRDFNARHPNEKWTADITELAIPGAENRKIYLSVILDLYDRYVVAFETSRKKDSALVIKTLMRALKENPGSRPLFHSDRGFEYTGAVLSCTLENLKIAQSVSRGGSPIDNAPLEGFWGMLKQELYCVRKIESEEELKLGIAEYLKYYNEERLQERFGDKTPAEVRAEAFSLLRKYSEERLTIFGRSSGLAPENPFVDSYWGYAPLPRQYPIPKNIRICAYWSELRQKRIEENMQMSFLPQI